MHTVHGLEDMPQRVYSKTFEGGVCASGGPDKSQSIET